MLRSIENICSYVQCRWRNVWRVYIDLNTLSCLNFFVQRVWGVYKMVVEIPKGWGGYFSGQKVEIPGRRGDLAWNSLRGGGMDIFWNYTFYFICCCRIKCFFNCNKNSSIKHLVAASKCTRNKMNCNLFARFIFWVLQTFVNSNCASVQGLTGVSPYPLSLPWDIAGTCFQFHWNRSYTYCFGPLKFTITNLSLCYRLAQN